VGFTLIEVIVVIVIIAILAAIGVPALTGYIDKAQDKNYIAQARNAMVAARAVIDDAYADGELSFTTSIYAKDGQLINNASGLRRWNLGNISQEITGDQYDFSRRAAALIGETYLENSKESGFWYPNFMGPAGSTVLNADGFLWICYPDGNSQGNPAIYITYKLERLNVSDGSDGNVWYTAWRTGGVYNPAAGFEIYHLVCA
jgi:prepilin-type N-terminal cleavage/methylation domain-containing protein